MNEAARRAIIRQTLALARREVQPLWQAIEERRERTFRRVLGALQEVSLSEADFAPSTGYGYGAPGRQKLEAVYARLMGTATALVHPSIVSGTHALTLALFAATSAGDRLVSLTGTPYDTLLQVIGVRGDAPGSLRSHGVSFAEVPLLPDGRIDWQTAKPLLAPPTAAVFLQRSRGYGLRPVLGERALRETIARLREVAPRVVILVDNCYGEFVEETEPGEWGADLLAGSLIKNPGGGLAPGGGYVAGREDLVERAASRLTVPGQGREIGPLLAGSRLLFQGLFLAPQAVAEALKGAVWAARLFSALGYAVDPAWDEPRSDLVQAIEMGAREEVLAFCQGIQSAAPVDHHLHLEGGDMPGYEDAIVMATGGFVQGGSLELSADGPLRPPYRVYLQGGLTVDHVGAGLEEVCLRLWEHHGEGKWENVLERLRGKGKGTENRP